MTNLVHGDPDLFISTTFQHPNAKNFTWGSQSDKGDSITIPHTDTDVCYDCTYYIGVVAYSNTTFTIIASYADTIALADGVPQSGYVQDGVFAYYTLQVLGGHEDVTVTLTSLSGMQSLFISTAGLPELDPDMPGWYDPWFESVKQIKIDESDPQACKNTTCTYSIGVYGEVNGTFTVSATTKGAAIPLLDGVPAKESVQSGEWEYFSFLVTEAGLDLSIVVTPITGDPDIYISRGNQRPNTTSNDKMSADFGGDIVDFEDAATGTYYIGVNSLLNSSFTITAFVTDDRENATASAVTLLRGDPQVGAVHRDHYRYYKFNLKTDEDATLSIVLTKTFGDPDMYVSADGTYPSKDHFTWSSKSNSDDTVSIPSASDGVYIIAVHGFTSAAYSIVATTQFGVATLQDSVAVRGSIDAEDEFRYYTLSVTKPDHPFTVSVTPFSGDPDLYISTDGLPNVTSSMWKSTKYRADSITIMPDDPNFCLGCKYYIGVTSYSPCKYSIAAHTSGLTQLVDGRPQTGQVSKGQYSNFVLNVRSDEKKDIQIGVTPINGDVEVHVSTEPGVTKDKY